MIHLHDTELEADIIGTLINYPDAIFAANSIINREAFTNANYRMLFDVIERLSIKNVKCDLNTICSDLRSKGRFNDNFTELTISDLSDRVYTASNINQHCLILKELQIRRDLIFMSKEIENKANDNTSDISDVIDFVQESVFKNTTEDFRSEPEHIGEVTAKLVDELEIKAKNPDKIGIPSGFNGLSWHDSDLIIGAGRPAMGKTYVGGIKWSFEAAIYGTPVLIFSLEMSKNQIVQRFVSLQTGIDSNKLRNAKLTPNEWQLVENAINYFNSLPIYIDDNAGLNVWQIQSKCRKMSIKHGIKLVVIDYLQLLSAKANTRDQEIGTITRTLKQIAKDLNIPVIALSQLNRSVEARGDKKPLLSDLRESGNIEQDADMVLFFYRPFYYSKNTDDAGFGEIIVAKYRHGNIGTYKFYHTHDWSRIENKEITDINIEAFKDTIIDIPTNNSFEDSPF